MAMRGKLRQLGYEWEFRRSGRFLPWAPGEDSD